MQIVRMIKFDKWAKSSLLQQTYAISLANWYIGISCFLAPCPPPKKKRDGRTSAICDFWYVAS